MAWFAQIGPSNLVTQVIYANESSHSLELTRQYGGIWVTCNPDQSGKFADTGYVYDTESGDFVPPQPYASWVLNAETFAWEPPVPAPDDGQRYTWDEVSNSWQVSNGD
jgi:hypothetical protein